MGQSSLSLCTVAVLLLGWTACHRAQQSSGQTRTNATEIFEVDSSREPDLVPSGTVRKPFTALSPGYGSRVIVFADGSAQYRVSAWKFCSSDCPNYGWIYRWDDSREQVFTGKVERIEMDRLKGLLDRDGKVLSGYANEGPMVGDFQILIHRASGQQSGVVIGLQPRWVISRPFVDLICEAKTIARRLSESATLPAWCSAQPER